MKKNWYLVLLAAFLLCSCTNDTPIEERTDVVYDDMKIVDAAGKIDFAALQTTNPDICAWLTIPGTNVDYPVLQNPTDDEMYLYTAGDGSEAVCGAIFTQATYNAVDFSDPVTVVYGNAMWDGTMFGSLQSTYSGMTGTEDFATISLHLPEETRTYTVFAAVPYDDTHIAYAYDFTDAYWYDNFFANVAKIRSIGAYHNADVMPQFGDQVIILSTSLQEDDDGRYLVMAVCHAPASNE